MDLIKESLEEFNIDPNEILDHWSTIFVNNDLTIDQIEKYKDVLDWNKFMTYQEVTDEIIERYFEDYMMPIEYSFEYLLSYQVLSEKFLDKYWKLIIDIEGLENLIKNQGLGEKLLYRAVEEKDSNTRNTWDFISEYQYLSENFILDNLNSLMVPKIISCQKLTSNIIKELGGIEKIKKNFYKELNENYLYKTDIGKDWFIGYVNYDYSASGRKMDNLYYTFTFLKDFREIYCYNRDIIKARIYYKDMWMTRIARRIEVIRGLEGNFWKR